MMKQMIKLTGIPMIVLIALMPGFLHGQDTVKTTTRSFQVAFITPLSSNGMNSWDMTNKISFNVLAGYAGGVDGVEFSGLVSVLKNSMNGAQFAGLGNVVLKDVTGAQFSGLYNIGLGNFRGAQFAGLLNVGTSKTGRMKGLQMAGFVNICAAMVSGAQIAGFLNYSDKLNGVQVGFINVTDSLERGVPVGFLSFVKNGYIAFEAGATETLYGVVSFKTGTRKFYNILSVGGGSRDGISLFAWGYGIGTFIPVGKKSGISVDGICYQVNEGEWFTNRLNLLNKVNICGSWQISSHLSLFGGVSWNVTVSDITDMYGDSVVSHIAPWSVYDETYSGYLNVKMYPGASVGLRL